MHDRDLVIHYVDAPPGTGKTQAVVEYMRRHIETSLDTEKRVGHIIYVAPTRELLDQTCENLESHVPQENHMRIFKAYSDSHKTRRSQSVPELVYSIMDSRKTTQLDLQPYGDGSVLFITHSTFLKLKRRHPTFARTTVFFDESRKWIEMGELDKDPGLDQLFRSLFKTKRIKSLDPDADPISLLVPKKIAENRKLSKLKSKNLATQFSALSGIHSDLSPLVNEIVRKKVYMVSTAKKLWTITLPHYPFKGFKRVFIMSADFEHSQMYHLFSAETSVRLRPITREFMDRYLPGGYSKALERIYERQRCLRILPLLKYEGMPSKYKLGNFILPAPLVYSLKTDMDKYDISTDLLYTLMKAKNDPSFVRGQLKPHQMEFLNRIGRYNTKINAVQWLVSQADRILKTRWFTPKDKIRKAVLFTNLKDMGKVRYDENLFSPLSIGKAEGRNEFHEYSAVAFFPAVNPDPQESHVLRTLLPDYNPDEDYIVDKAIQCIGRGNIRNHKADGKKMLAIVSTTHLADRLLQRMAQGAKVYDPEEFFTGPVYTFWDHAAAKATQDDIRLAVDLPINKLLRNVRVNISRQKKAGNAELLAKYKAEEASLLARKADAKQGTENE